MAVTGRSASSAPRDSVKRVADAVGVSLPDDDAHLEAYGALGGIATGLGIGVVASLGRSAGIRFPAPLAASAIGALAMAATDAPMAAGGVSDPRDWSTRDWARDVVPHLAYGIGVHWTMNLVDRGSDRTASQVADVAPSESSSSRWGLLARATALGIAAGARSSLAVGGPVLSGRGGKAGVAAAVLVSTELVADKSPAVSSRLQPGPLAGRVVGGGLGAAALARGRDDAGAAGTSLAAIAGAGGAWVGAVAGAGWREAAAARGWTWQAGLVEDFVALGLTLGACRRRS
jgi:hypothetical protein